MNKKRNYQQNFGGNEYYEKVKGCECICSVRRWNNAYDKDIKFIIP